MKANKKNTDRVIVTFAIDLKQRSKAKALAEKEDRPVSSVYRQAVADYLERRAC